VQVFIFDMPSSLLEFIHQVSDSCSSSNSQIGFHLLYSTGDGGIFTHTCVFVITPRTCARGKAIGFVLLSVCLFVTTKNARSEDVLVSTMNQLNLAKN
jgi:hypothetical protein